MSVAPHVPSFPFSREEDSYLPTPENARLRHQCPMSKVKLFDGTEAWIVMKHKDVCHVLNSCSFTADRRAHGYPEIHEGGKKAREAQPTFVNMDDPEHANQRAMLEDAFTLDAVEELRPMIQETIDSVIRKFIESKKTNETIDLIEHFATAIPTQIMYRILGVPEEDVEELSKDSEIRTSTSRNAAESSNHRLQDYMTQLVEKRIQNPKHDLISKLVVEQYQRDTLKQEDISALAFLVLTAGNAALINSIGLGVLTLCQYPDQLDLFKNNLELAPAVVRELLRYNTTSALNSRRATKQPVTLRDQEIGTGVGIICSVQSADRDEDVTSNPETFDISRDYKFEDLLGFGYGPHRCQGQWLSKLELEMVFKTLFQKIPNLKVAVPMKDLKFTPPSQNIGVLSLPVVW